MTCGTFAQAAVVAIRHEARHLARRTNFAVIGNEEATALIAQLIGDRAAAVPEAQMIHHIYSYSVNTLLPVDVVVMDRFPWLFWAKDSIRAVLRRYEEEKVRRNVVVLAG